jgi:hypothetical protein
MYYRTRFVILLIFLVSLAGCSQSGGPVAAIESYLRARVESDSNKLRVLSCAEWEAQAMIQADSFKSMDAKIDTMTCSESGTDGDATLVACEGKIITTYNGESREWPLGKYRAVQEDGEWKMCGEAR